MKFVQFNNIQRFFFILQGMCYCQVNQTSLRPVIVWQFYVFSCPWSWHLSLVSALFTQSEDHKVLDYSWNIIFPKPCFFSFQALWFKKLLFNKNLSISFKTDLFKYKVKLLAKRCTIAISAMPCDVTKWDKLIKMEQNMHMYEEISTAVAVLLFDCNK